MRRNFLLRTAAVAGLAGLLAGCGTVSKVTGAVGAVMDLVGLGGTRLSWKEVEIAAAVGANQNSAVAVDIVLVLRPEAVDRIVALPASKWFQTRAELQRTFPGQYLVHSWEVAPGQLLRVPGERFGTPSVVGVFVFADYLAPGEHRMKVTQLEGGIMVELAARGFTVSAKKAD
jgi:type VI secretion system protein